METPPLSTKKTLRDSASKISLTPCRRLGLGRPLCTARSLKKALMVNTLASPVERNVEENIVVLDGKSTIVDNHHSSPFCSKLNSIVEDHTTHSALNKMDKKARRCLIQRENAEEKFSTSKVNCIARTFRTSKNNNSPGIKRLIEDNTVNSLNCKKPKLAQNDHFNPYNTIESSSTLLCDNNFTEISAITTEMIENLASSIVAKKKRLEECKVRESYMKKHDLVELREQTSKWKSAGQEALRYSLHLAKQAGYSVTLQQLMSQHGFHPHQIGYDSEEDEFS